MMNNRGQSLVLFILIIPILIGIIALVFDCGRMLVCKNNQENIAILALEYGLHDDEVDEISLEKILAFNFENGKYRINKENDEVNVALQSEVDGLFSSLFGFLKFKVITEYQGTIHDGEKIYNKIR